MTLCVPRNAAPEKARRLEPVSFCLTAFGDEKVIFRLTDGSGDCLDLVLNPVVAGAMRDCLALNPVIGRAMRQDGQKDWSG